MSFLPNSLIISAVTGFFKIAHWIWPYKMHVKFSRLKNKLFTNWIAPEFKNFGKFISIEYPFNLVGGKYISLGTEVVISKRGILAAWDKYAGQTFNPVITIGSNTSIGEDVHISAINQIIIGAGVLIGKKVTIVDNGHGRPDIDLFNLKPLDRPLYSNGPVVIEDNVWIGDKVTILSNVNIGKNCIIGANSVVTKNIPANCVAGGIPAVIIKHVE